MAVWCRDDLAPLMDIMEALRSAKLSLQCIQFRAVEYLISAEKVVAARPIPPVVESTSGVNVACSISHTYFLLFSCSCLRYTGDSGSWRFDWALGLKSSH